MVQPTMSIISNFWQAQLQLLESTEVDFKNHQLPLARIKKVMKTDDDVKQMVFTQSSMFIVRR
jgi:nuclear transcription factor Y gamma